MTKHSECVNYSITANIEKSIKSSYLNLLTETEYGHRDNFITMSLESIEEINCILPLDYFETDDKGE